MVELRNPTGNVFRIKDIAERQREYRLVREGLEDALFGLLRRGEVLSSADNPLGDPERPRILVDTEVYKDRRLSYDPDGECIEGSNFRLLNVQVFSRNRVPAGLEDALSRPAPPSAISSATRGLGEPGLPPSGLAAFRYDSTYEHVWIGEQEFSLTKLQAGIVCELHRAALNGQPWIGREQLREAVRFEFGQAVPPVPTDAELARAHPVRSAGQLPSEHLIRERPRWGRGGACPRPLVDLSPERHPRAT